MQSSYIEVERARSKPIFQKCHTLPSETNCTSGESREIYLDEDVIIFTVSRTCCCITSREKAWYRPSCHGLLLELKRVRRCSPCSLGFNDRPVCDWLREGWDPEATLRMDIGLGAPGCHQGFFCNKYLGSGRQVAMTNKYVQEPRANITFLLPKCTNKHRVRNSESLWTENGSR